ncbi:MAG: dGTP triphosphohydrolase [Verrucomicrobiota bacterium]
MTNSFYNPFDLEQHPKATSHQNEYRNPFQIERDRVIFSSPFRQLQSKTQVFQSGEYDFYRTRLTHSIEVAKIGRSICEFLKADSEHLNDAFYIDADLTEAIGLAHDLGHPPFGHIGERKLNKLMASHGGFEGNAQTLRILTELIYERPGKTMGIAPTRAFVDGVMKYKALQSEWQTTNGSVPENHFIYNDQADWRELAFGGEQPTEKLGTPQALNQLKSIECQIMDWADDTAYSLHDIVDGIRARYITVGSLTEWATQRTLESTQSEFIETLCRKISTHSYEPYFGSRVGTFVHACSLEPRNGFLSKQTHRHAFDLKIDPDVVTESKLYKKIASDLIFKSTQLQQIEFKGGYILEKLFGALRKHCISKQDRLGLLPPQTQQLIDQEKGNSAKYRRLCDYTAALTDGQAVRTYKRLFNPDFGSIAELV